jgi:hypothetical protein
MNLDPTTLMFMVILVDLFIIAACVVIGSSKGRTGEGLIFGLLLGPIGLIITICLRKAKPVAPYVPPPPPVT